MQDTKNLIKKRDVEYPKLIKEAKSKGDDITASFWEAQLEQVKHKIENRNKNKKKNDKQFRKAN
jgi:hypothetical protein